MQPGARNLITDVEGLRVGNAEDDVLKSGVTCLVADAPFTAAVDIRGGAPGTRDIALLAPDKTVPAVDALVLSGGSAFGLDAPSGVMDGLRADGRGFAVGPAKVPIVPGAIIFDLLNGGRKDWQANPYAALGRQAYRAAGGDFALGTAGAGTGALTARLKGGLGSASAVLASGYTVGALVVVNPVGCVTPPGERRFWAAGYEIGQEFGGLGVPPGPFAPLTAAHTKMALDRGEGANTTIAVVATDCAMDKAALTRLAVAAHDGLARAIQPSHTPFDGDLVFAVSTGARPVSRPGVDALELGHAAAVVLARAVARGVHAARPMPGDPMPVWASSPT
ncbi:P1 family peptidase [Algicella marina]|uniref:Peptidase T4 n=1 Tax=Algicella marina TaxID=2683284 RepID=A0A6P1T0V2_9RHOB|nr:P1 family peptidase [Algicella marina]QHQ36368.1 peptidase T4 [Algicella marina]